MIGPRGRRIWRDVVRNRTAAAGLAVLALLYASAVLAPFLSPYSYDHGDRRLNFHPPMIGRIHLRDPEGRWHRPFVHAALSSGSGRFVYAEDPARRYPIRVLVHGDRYRILGLVDGDLHLFGVDDGARLFLLGSDQAGRDLLSRILWGGRVSLSVGLVGIAISVPIGLLVGGIAGYRGGRVDFVLMRLVEVILSIPALYLVLTLRYAFTALHGVSSAHMYVVIVAILAAVGWASLARVVRGMVLALRESEYVLAARALGRSDLGVLVRHVLPGTLSFVIVSATLSLPGYILSEVALSFLGAGVEEPEASWGNLLRAAQDLSNLTAYPWIVLPGAFLFVAVLAFNLVGDALRDAADPRGVVRVG